MIEAILILLMAIAVFFIGAIWAKRIYTDKITVGPTIKWCQSCDRNDGGFCLFAMVQDDETTGFLRCRTEAPTMYKAKKNDC